MSKPPAATQFVALAILAVIVRQSAYAQELEPRAYANLPVGLNFLQFGYSYSSGGILFDPQIPLDNVKADVNAGYLAYIRALDVADRSANFLLVLPYASLSGSGDLAGEPVRRDVSGFADPTLGFSITLVGAPALPASEFSSYRQNLNMGVSFFARPPLGQYDEERAVNIGTNRWAFKAQAGLSKAVGRWIFESLLAATAFTDNKEYLVDRTRSQDPVYALQLHAVYNFPSQIWIGVGGTYYKGGDATTEKGGNVVGLRGPRNSRVGATLSLPIDSRNSIRFQGSTSVNTAQGTDFNIFVVTWQYRWGAGL